jgi:hypothetical protein
MLSLYVMLPATLGPRFTQPVTNECQKQIEMFPVSRARWMRETDNLTANLSRLSSQCGILNVSSSVGIHGLLTGIVFLFYIVTCLIEYQD